ncbi:MAG: hypothetical protein GY839_07995 [candidate division Zixibacteria bacterium]|nr:hypothetical protein [candidate division Zixibacteria bacterium]
MKNLIPHFIIGITAIVCGLIWGFWGLLIGLIASYIVITLLGLSLIKTSKGILPRDVRQNTASKFLKENKEWLKTRIPSQHNEKELQFLENLLDSIAKIASILGPSTSSGFSHGEMEAAVELLTTEEIDPNIAEIVERLWPFIEAEWYGASSEKI